MKKNLFLLSFFYSALLFATNTAPKLIVQIVIDQLRGDLLTQYRQDFGKDGFNYLLDHAINYQNAHYPQALTVTCVGHATLSTGSIPSFHGIIANDWYDPLTKKIVYCTSDPKNPILPTVRSITKGSGQSPNNLLVSTFSDELVLAQRGRAFGVSLKDRSAITLAGHAGKAFWFDKEHGGFITSQYYYQHYPRWVDNWNSHYQPKNERWTLMQPVSTYHFAHIPPAPRHKIPVFGKKFPHSLGDPTSLTYYQYLAMSPFADELTAQFAMTLLQNEKLGITDKKTDYLAISFSAVDVIGHQFGPNSLESEDNLRRLDKTIANVLKTIDAQVGLQNTLLILTADHGIIDSPDWLKINHIHTIPAFNINHLQSLMNDLLMTKFKLPSTAIELIHLPYVYLNHQLISENKLSVADVSSYLAKKLCQEPTLFAAYPLPLMNNADDWLSNKVKRMSFPNRSGDLFLVSKPYQDISDSAATLSHGSPWNYDSYVPLLFVNPHFKSTRIAKLVYTTDIAVTLTGLLLLKPPSASIGNPLTEVIKLYDKIAQ